MNLTCPICGGQMGQPVKHRGELERQLGSADAAAALRERARQAGPDPVRLDDRFIAWRGYVWTRVRLRKAARCLLTGRELPPGAWAYRNLSEVANREWRVDANAWDALASAGRDGR